MDTLTPAERSERMARVRGRDTKPEIAVRKLLFSMGYRYRLHDKLLPGTPDIVLPSRRKIILVHGCFWHRHSGCRLARMPKSRKAFWSAKLENNRLRDGRVKSRLRRLGWSVATVWECRLADMTRLEKRLRRFLESGNMNA
ncbi:MAG: DNA mismatch endonuclease Vsr [Ectothiorhodospiraceae bacterium]|jgi:DNA mismatch endonuclease (patch repair protein)|nr:DNA mismatch endonuclease Vsr [Ectothiorhodospiraceae bacterium]